MIIPRRQWEKATPEELLVRTKEELEPTGGKVPIRRDLIERGGRSELGLEAPSGFEPLHRSFADCSLTTWVRRLGGSIIIASFSRTQPKANRKSSDV